MHHLQVEAENFPEISLRFEVVAVPTFLLLKVHVHVYPHARLERNTGWLTGRVGTRTLVGV